MRFVKSAQRLGFSLDEIAELLRLEDGTHCEEASSLAEHKLGTCARGWLTWRAWRPCCLICVRLPCAEGERFLPADCVTVRKKEPRSADAVARGNSRSVLYFPFSEATQRQKRPCGRL